MTISFNQIPDTIRVPLCYVEFDNSQAVQGTPSYMSKIMVFGQMLETGAATPGSPVQVLSADHGVKLFGRGSMLAAMIAGLKGANAYTETWAVPLADDAEGVAASGALTVTGPATGSGTLALYVAGVRVRVAVAAADTAAVIATKIAAAIAAEPDLPVTAAVNGAVPEKVDLTCRWKGETGNAIDLRLGYYGETLPSGVGVAVTALSGGTANPDLADALAALGDSWWNYLCTPYTDAANMAALEAELDARGGPLKMVDGVAFAALAGSHAASTTWGAARNHQAVSCMAMGQSPTPPWTWAAVNCGVVAYHLDIDPARPLQTLELPGCLPPAVEDRWTMVERNLLLYSGLATHTVTRDGAVQIERQITTYQTNSYGLPDPSYLDVTTPATLSYLRYAIRTRITQKFPRHKLADDGTRFSPGQAIATPRIVRAELLALFRELEAKGLVENFDSYKATLLVERDPDDRNRLNVRSNPDLVNQLRIYAQQVQFIL